MIPRVTKGQRPSASHQNKIVDQLNKLATLPGPGGVGSDQAGQKIFVLNNTGMDLELGMVAPFKPSAANPYDDNPMRQVLGTVGELYDPTDWTTEDTDGDDPPWNNWVIMAQRIPDGQSGWAYASGIVLARVRDENTGSATETYQYADLTAWEEGSGDSGWYHLNRTPAGGARILWIADTPEDAGSATEAYLWALIRFTGAPDQAVVYTPCTDTDTPAGRRVLADSDPVSAVEYFAPLPYQILAIPARTADGQSILLQCGPMFATATSDPEDGELTVKLTTSDGTQVGDDLTVFDGGL